MFLLQCHHVFEARFKGSLARKDCANTYENAAANDNQDPEKDLLEGRHLAEVDCVQTSLGHG